VEVEASKRVFDLVNFDLLLRGFPSFKMVSFLLQFTLTNYEKKKNAMNSPTFLEISFIIQRESNNQIKI
jgi:hypothetical protein